MENLLPAVKWAHALVVDAVAIVDGLGPGGLDSGNLQEKHSTSMAEFAKLDADADLSKYQNLSYGDVAAM